MKYVKFSLVDNSTKISVLRKRAKEPVFPDIKGLQLLLQDNRMPEWYYGQADDDAVTDPNNENCDLTEQEFKDIIKDNINTVIQKRLEELVTREIEIRESLLGKYHVTAVIAGGYKYEQAIAYLKDNTISCPEIELEARIRGITVTELANRIKSHHEEFKTIDAKIAGIRGLLQKRLSEFVINENDPWSSYKELLEKVETVLDEKLEAQKDGIIKQDDSIIIPSNISYYGTDILERYHTPSYS